MFSKEHLPRVHRSPVCRQNDSGHAAHSRQHGRDDMPNPRHLRERLIICSNKFCAVLGCGSHWSEAPAAAWKSIRTPASTTLPQTLVQILRHIT